VTAVASRVISVDQRCRSIAAATPHQPAVIGFGRRTGPTTLTWGELDRESADRARLLDHGGRPGPADAVVTFGAPSQAETVIRILACLRARVPFLPLDPGAPAAERERLLRAAASTGPVRLWDGRTAPVAPSGSAPARTAEPPGTGGPAAQHAPGTPGYLLATGSSSGRPRLIAHPGPPGYDPARVPNPLLRATGWQSGQRQLVVGPLHHAAPLTTCLEALLDGNTLVLQETFDPRAAVKILDEYAVEWMELTPTHMQWMLIALERENPELGSLRSIVHTAARCPGPVKRAWIDRLGPTRVFEFYGATEGIGMTLVRGDEWLARPGTVGRGFCTQIRILDDRGRALPPGATGEIYLRSSGFLAGQAAPPGPAAAAGPVKRTADGFRSVGDHGWLDEQKYLFLSPRREDMVVIGGANVYPAEVENVLADHPQIQDCAVVATPDGLVGSRLVAFVVPRPAAAPAAAAVLAFCSERLAQHKVPAAVRFVGQVPRSEAGKLQRWRLAEAVEAGTAPGKEDRDD
jgi:bile acid-coenzyme A ligase